MSEEGDYSLINRMTGKAVELFSEFILGQGRTTREQLLKAAVVKKNQDLFLFVPYCILFSFKKILFI